MTGCPPADQLLGFAAGNLSDDACASVESHIDACATCRESLSSLAKREVTASGFGRYRLETVLGSGGMGIVYRAWDPQLARPVAIKVVKHAADDEANRARLIREAQSLARLSHPNVCHVYDVGTDGDEVWVAMELIEGSTLREWAHEQGSSLEIERVLLAAAEGISAAHEAGIVHRDVKPENVLVARDGHAVVTDFGLARVNAPIDPNASTAASGDPQMTMTATGAVAGTPAYLAPEQLTGSAIDARVDQFAWATMAWELLTGMRPFPIIAGARLDAIRAGLTPPPSLPRPLAAALARALALAPRDRFPTMRALIDAIGVPTRTTGSRRTPMLAAAALVVVAGGAFAAVQLTRSDEPRARPPARATADPARTAAPPTGTAGTVSTAPASSPAPPSPSGAAPNAAAGASASPGTASASAPSGLATAPAPSNTAGASAPSGLATRPAPSSTGPAGTSAPAGIATAPSPSSTGAAGATPVRSSTAPNAGVASPAPSRIATAPTPAGAGAGTAPAKTIARPADPPKAVATSAKAPPSDTKQPPPSGTEELTNNAGGGGFPGGVYVSARPFSRDRAISSIDAFCGIPYDGAHPDPHTPHPIIDWGKVTKREVVTATLGGRAEKMLLYEVAGQRGTYHFDGDEWNDTIGQFDAPVGQLVVLCQDNVSEMHQLPGYWKGPLGAMRGMLPVSGPPRSTELAKLAPLHISDISLRRDGGNGTTKLDPARNYLVRAKVDSSDGANRWYMEKWWMDVPPGIPGAKLVGEGKYLWFVITKPELLDQPDGNKPHLVVHAIAVLDSMFPE